MKVWFMFDNHSFALVGDSTTSRRAMRAKARELFLRDGSGDLFARDENERHIAELQGSHTINGGVTDYALNQFFDRIEEYTDWTARG